MSNITKLSPDKEKKRPSVSSKCLLNIKSIVTQNVSLNSNNKNTCLRSPTSILPPLPLIDSLISSKESINHLDDIEENKRIIKKLSDKQISTTNGHDRSNNVNGESKSISIHIPEILTCKKDHEELQSNIISKESNSEQYPSLTSLLVNNNELSIIPPLPLSSSMYPFDSSSTSSHRKPLLSFPAHSSNRISEEYLTQLHQIIASSDNTNDIKPTELPIYRHQPISIHRFDSASPTISTIDDDEDDDININGPLIFVNNSLNLSMNSNSPTTVPDQTVSFKSRLSERSEKEFHNNRKVMNNHNQHYPTNYTRLPYSLRNKNPSFHHPSQSGAIRSPIINNPPIRRQFPEFESVRTPVEKSSIIKQEIQSPIPSELFDCCQTETVSLTTEIIRTQRNSQRRIISIENNLNESEVRSNYFRDVAKIREIMINASKRLTQNQDSISELPIVDTHCHFDLIFDRLRIKHNDLKKYFNDYKEYYPSGLSFKLAIQVFWRPKQLTEDNWLNWYSKYLDDERVYGSCGIHPHWSSAWNETSIDDIERCLQHPKIVAIGEIGLDFGPKNTCLMHEQCRAFEAQLKLAAKWLKPIVIHSRDAYEITFKLMKQYLEPNHKIHLHCFVGTIDDVYLFTSYFTEIKFGFTPIITRYNFLHTVIQELELTQILSETDSPYFTPEELSTYSRCAHPGMVYSVVEMIAQLRHTPVFDVACQLRENARHIYGI